MRRRDAAGREGLPACLWREFANPPVRYRGKPLWSWTGRLKEGELRRQIRTFRRMGFGGFFTHPRAGLATAYLSREWFRLVGACVDEARRAGRCSPAPLRLPPSAGPGGIRISRRRAG